MEVTMENITNHITTPGADGQESIQLSQPSTVQHPEKDSTGSRKRMKRHKIHIAPGKLPTLSDGVPTKEQTPQSRAARECVCMQCFARFLNIEKKFFFLNLLNHFLLLHPYFV